MRIATILLLLFTLPLQADEPKKKWPPEVEKFLDSQPLLKARVGDEVVYRVQFDLPWQKGKGELAHRIVKVTDREITLSVNIRGEGQPQTNQDTLDRYIKLRNVPTSTQAKSPMAAKIELQIVAVKQEELLLFDKTYKTWRLTATGEARRGPMTVSVTGDYWICPDVPYVGLVKSRVTSTIKQESGGSMQAKGTMLLLRWKRGDAGSGSQGDQAARSQTR